jgi:imidazolonepropionase-like amidohydrolase
MTSSAITFITTTNSSDFMKRLVLFLPAVFACIVCPAPSLASDQIPGAPQKKPIALVNGIIHTIAGPVIEGGTIVFDKGVIVDAGPDVAPPDNAQVIDLDGKHVYPSLIESHSRIGLTEIAAVRASLDYAETGKMNPNVSARLSVNPDSELIPVTRAGGVLIAVSAPSSGIVSGRASVMQMDGWTYEDMTLQADVAMIVNWPRMTPRSFRNSTPTADGQTNERNRDLQALRDLFDDAKAYGVARSTNPEGQRYDIRLEAMGDVIDGKVPLMIMARRVLEIESAVSFAVEHGVKIIIFGGHDAPQCADLLKRYDVPVIVSSVHRNPMRRHEDYDASYTLANRLHELGIRFCISCSDRSETWNTRNLGHQAATAAAFGLPRDEALRSVTLYPAQILGIADRVGTLENGRDATLFVCDASPLETEVQISQAWIQGRKVDLTSRHTSLYKKYQQKYQQQK